MNLRLTLSSPFLCPHLLEMERFQTKSRVCIKLSWSLDVLFVETQEVSVAEFSYRQSTQLESQEVLARCKFPLIDAPHLGEWSLRKTVALVP